MNAPAKAGLEDVVVSTSDICFIDGDKGRLLYRGYDIDDLVAHSTFEEVTYLLWYGALPTKKELDAHNKTLAASRRLPPKMIDLLRALPRKTTPMEVLRTGVSALSAFDPDAADNSRDATLRKSIRLTAQMPTIVAAWERIRRGRPIIPPNPRMNLAANFLYMLTGKKPTDLAAKTFDVALTPARLPDLLPAVTSSIAASKGPQPGPAKEQGRLGLNNKRTPAKGER